MSQDTMPHPGHENHLCYLVTDGDLKPGTPEYKKLVKKAKYVCTGCGRAAARPENLCAPEKI
jgi:hypothetical protein